MKVYPYAKAQGPVKWVSTEWLGDHLEDDQLMIVDCQPNVHEYIKEHIPGARYIPEGIFRAHAGLPTNWIPPEAAQFTLRAAGLKNDLPVVVYCSRGPLTMCGNFIGDGLEQTMVTYSLARFNHKKVYVLDGGLEKWKAEERPLTQKFPAFKSSDFRAELQKDFIMGIDELKSVKDRSDHILIDARPAAVYEGQGPWIRPGHIPGAVSIPWVTLMNTDNRMLLKTDDEIHGLIMTKGATPDKTIITSCGTGREATNEFILFKFYLGYPKVKLYEGGFTEWSADPANPAVTGKNPR
jgi:thiosulfate/3-mercaptopyruvate sulfurtransferase